MLRDEVKMIAGIATDDMDYIGYHLLKDGSYFKKEEKESEKPKPILEAVDDLKVWFDKI